MAQEYLRQNNYDILTANYRCRYGEIDIIARDCSDGYLSFIEVKYRSSLRYGFPYEAVGREKQKRIRRSSMEYLKEYQLSQDSRCRYDVVSIYDKEIILIKNAFGGF